MAKNENRRSVYCGPPIQDLLRLVGDDKFSQALNRAVERYLAIMDANRPALSKGEWCAICDVLNGTMTEDPVWIQKAGRLIAMEIQDAEPDGVFKKWKIDGHALAKKLAGLSTAEGLAVLHVVETFWANCESGTDEALAIAGIK